MRLRLRRDDVTAVILAGGRGRRMGGVCKPLVLVDGETIYQRQAAVLERRVGEIVVSIAEAATWPRHRMILDEFPSVGPLGGIASSLTADRPWFLVVAGDMPWLAPALIDGVLARCTDEVDIVIPRVNGYIEPLLAAYRGVVGPLARARIARGELRATGLVEEPNLRIAWLHDADLRGYDPELASFRSINQPSDLPGG